MSGPGRAPEATVGNDPAYALAGASSPTAAMRHSVSFFTASPLVPCRRPRRVRGPEPAIEHGDAVALLVGQREVEDRLRLLADRRGARPHHHARSRVPDRGPAVGAGMGRGETP